MNDRSTRALALAALALALVALVIAGYALSVALASRQAVDSLERRTITDGFPPLPLDGPPPSLDTGEM